MAPERAPASGQYSFEPLGEGMTFARAREEGTALSNAGIVELGGSTLVFDTSLTLGTARELGDAARAVTGRAATLVANSHWHLDHMLGNQLFAEAPIYATQRTIAILLEKRSELEAELGREKLSADVRELEERFREATTEAGRRAYAHPLRLNRALLSEALELRFTPPTQGFEGDLTLPGERHARLMTFGAGHTESDAVLFLPDEGVLFAGDLIVRDHHPNLLSGEPEHWLTVLREIERLRPQRIGTGHGPAGTLETLAEMRDYLETILSLAREPGEVSLPARFRSWKGPEQFEQNLAFLRARGAPTAAGPGR